MRDTDHNQRSLSSGVEPGVRPGTARHRDWRDAAPLAAVLALTSCASRNPAPSRGGIDAPAAVALRIVHHRGETVRAVMRATSGRVPAGDRRTTSADVAIETLRVEPDGSAVRRLRFESLDVAPIAPELAPIVGQMRAGYLQFTLEFTQRANGEVTLPAGEAPPANPVDAAARAFAVNVLTLLPRLPDRPVRPGEHWSVVFAAQLVTAPLRSETTVHRDYQLRGIVREGGRSVAEIDYTSTEEVVPGEGADGVPRSDGEAHGSLRLVLDSAEVIASDETGTLTLRGALPDGTVLPPSRHEFALRARQ